MLNKNSQLWVKLLILSSSGLFLAACDRVQPQSYTIPKEERPATPPPVATQKPAASAPANMQVLPGMAEAAQSAGKLQFQTPAGWQKKQPSGIRKAELTYTGDDGSATITVTVFPGDVGGLLANINRWRGQVELPAITTNDLPQFTTTRTISNHRATYVRLPGESKSILGGLLPFHGKTWFFKMNGETAAVLAQETALLQFLDSVLIEDPYH
jgi:hypothetical protein